MPDSDQQDKNSAMLQRLQVLTQRKETLFRRIQATYDLISSLNKPTVKDNFIIRCETLDKTVSEFDQLLDQINTISLQINPKNKPNFDALSAMDDLICHILAAKKKLDLNVQNVNTSTSTSKYNVLLPPLDIKPFSGQNISDWPRFKNLFCSVIKDEVSFSSVQKSHYLHSLLREPASRVVHAYQASSNFEAAWAALCNRYESDRVLANYYFQEILKTYNPPSRPSLQSLQSFITKVGDNICSLKSLNIPNLSEFILFSLAIRQLDVCSRQEFELECIEKSFPTCSELLDFVNKRCRMYEVSASDVSCNSKFSSVDKSVSKKVVLSTQIEPVINPVHCKPVNVVQVSRQCPLCFGLHPLYRCSVFLGKTPNERNRQVKSLRGCFNCLSLTHILSKCKSKISCSTCKQRHHSLLHFPKKIYSSDSVNASNSGVNKLRSQSPEALNLTKNTEICPQHDPSHVVENNYFKDSPSVSLATSSSTASVKKSAPINEDCDSHIVLLGTALAQIQDVSGNFVTIRLVIDCGSTSSFITSNLVSRLNLPQRKHKQQFLGLNSSQVASSTGLVSCIIKPNFSTHFQLSMEAFVVSSIVGKLPSVPLPDNLKNQYLEYNLADPQFYISQPVDVLLGGDVFCKIFLENQVACPDRSTNVISTIFGDIILGPIKNVQNLNSIPELALTTCNVDSTLNELVNNFWLNEEIHLVKPPDPQDLYCEDHFVKTHKRDSQGRYLVKLPFKVIPEELKFPQSYTVALNRFLSLERRLGRDADLKTSCFNFMREYLALGHMIVATRPGKYYIPYFCVHNPSSLTTKVRVVFDGSARQSHKAINEVLHTGQKLQNDICIILHKFRSYVYVFATDITKMFRQILVDSEDCLFQHILFRENPCDPIVEYELKTVTYGLTSSPFHAERVMIQVADDEGSRFPLAANILKNNRFVDDIFAGSDTLDNLIKLKNELCCLLENAGMYLNKWSSNSSLFLSQLREESNTKPLTVCDDPSNGVKILGMLWYPSTDSFGYRISLRNSEIPTKRSVLSTIARFFDPMGFVAPLTFKLKCFLQDLWKEKLDWDAALPLVFSKPWQKLISLLPVLETLSIPRCVLPPNIVSCQILGFCDASEKGYCGCVYLRVVFSSREVSCFLLQAKTKVAPLKILSIPRLELLGAVMLSKLLATFEPLIALWKPQSIFLFTDSTTVFSWLHTPTYTLKTFVAHRVEKILKHTDVSMWYHVNSENNIADIASRGATPQELLSRDDWLKGPPWSHKEITSWPCSSHEVLDEVPETKLPRYVLLTISSDPIKPVDFPITNFSSIFRLQRVCALVFRFVNRCRLKSRYNGLFSITELRNSLKFCVRVVQYYHFSSEINLLRSGRMCAAKFQRFSPFLDSDGFLRVGGRLCNSSLGYDARHPYLLPKRCHFTELIVNHYHRNYLHAGPRVVRYLIQRQFWIIQAHSIIRQIIFKCVRCRRFNAQVASPLMGNLPSARVSPSRPFSNVCLDYAGPFTLKESLRKNARTYKGYFSIIVCMATKACHLEAVTSLTTEAFLASLNRFISRRGLCSHIYCDQGTNFKGASRQMRELFQFIRSQANQQTIVDTLASREVQFHFSVPHAPFMNGLAESNVKNVKYHLLREVGSRVITLTEFNTILCKIEAILNSRPLYELSSSPDDYEALTPGHFLIGAPLLALPEMDVTDVNVNLLSRWEVINQVTQRLWKRWEKEYLHTLQQKNKWFVPDKNLALGQLVWIKEDNSPPLSYLLGRIKSVKFGSDGVARSAIVATRSGDYDRPVRKLAPLTPP